MLKVRVGDSVKDEPQVGKGPVVAAVGQDAKFKLRASIKGWTSVGARRCGSLCIHRPFLEYVLLVTVLVCITLEKAKQFHLTLGPKTNNKSKMQIVTPRIQLCTLPFALA